VKIDNRCTWMTSEELKVFRVAQVEHARKCHKLGWGRKRTNDYALIRHYRKQGWGYTEIAGITGIPRSSVRYAISVMGDVR
jgi:hypothetical protein